MIERRGNDILKLKIGGDKFAELSAVEQAPAVTPVPVQSRMHSINFLAENEKFLARKVSECREGQGVLLTIKGNGDATTEIIGGSSGRGV
jgi:hypothetical protein